MQSRLEAPWHFQVWCPCPSTASRSSLKVSVLCQCSLLSCPYSSHSSLVASIGNRPSFASPRGCSIVLPNAAHPTTQPPPPRGCSELFMQEAENWIKGTRQKSNMKKCGAYFQWPRLQQLTSQRKVTGLN